MLVHAVRAPPFFVAVSPLCIRTARAAAPWFIAVGCVAYAMVMDLVAAAFVVHRSLDMFASSLGTGIPFGLIVLATHATGLNSTRATTSGQSAEFDRRTAGCTERTRVP